MTKEMIGRFETLVKISADTPDRLRACDVDRLMDHAAETIVNESHPAPWAAESGNVIVTLDSLGTDDMAGCIGYVCDGYAGIFVDAVNGFYGEKRGVSGEKDSEA